MYPFQIPPGLFRAGFFVASLAAVTSLTTVHCGLPWNKPEENRENELLTVGLTLLSSCPPVQSNTSTLGAQSRNLVSLSQPAVCTDPSEYVFFADRFRPDVPAFLQTVQFIEFSAVRDARAGSLVVPVRTTSHDTSWAFRNAANDRNTYNVTEFRVILRMNPSISSVSTVSVDDAWQKVVDACGRPSL